MLINHLGPAPQAAVLPSLPFSTLHRLDIELMDFSLLPKPSLPASDTPPIS